MEMTPGGRSEQVDEAPHLTQPGEQLPLVRQARREQLESALRERLLIIDGAMGTEIQRRRLPPEAFGGKQFEGCNEAVNLFRPEVIREIHVSYLEAGADIIETNSFGGTRLVLSEYGLGEQAPAINYAAARLAREAADAFTARTPDKPRFVAGSMGPTTRSLSVIGDITFDELVANYYEQAKALVEGGVDYLLLETAHDTRNVKAGLVAVDRLARELGEPIPVAVSATVEPRGTMLAGQNVEAFVISLEHADLLYIGLNCGTGPELMTDHLRTMAEMARVPVACVPNAGLPDEHGEYRETPEVMARVMNRFIEEGWVNLIGGCCGTNPAHIRALAALVPGRSPRRPGERLSRRPDREHRALAPAAATVTTATTASTATGAATAAAATAAVTTATATTSTTAATAVTRLSGIEPLEVDETTRPILVGERTNVVGSREFRELIKAGKFEEAADIARRQVRGGAQVIDICLASSDPDRDELADMERFLAEVVNRVRVPLMIDSTNPRVIERALTYCQGKSIINSINLENGEERFREIVPLARRFGAALVVGTIDEQGMAISRERKLAVARRSYELLTHQYGVAPQDIIFDPLTFPCASGDPEYTGAARETIEAIRLLKSEFPLSKTILGISNVSFGLPPAGREVVNSVFLYHAVQAGLDFAIVNTERLPRFPSLPEAERKLAEEVLFETDGERLSAAIARFADYFRRQAGKSRTVAVGVPGGAASSASSVSSAKVASSTSSPGSPGLPDSLDERLARYVVEGTKDGLIEDLERKLKTVARPLDIISGPLMEGMSRVGKLFAQNQLIVAEVLQSAEVMKAAVAYLRPFIEQGGEAGAGAEEYRAGGGTAATSAARPAGLAVRGKIVLATVKGDVHDIGKNLVSIIFSSNGYQVIDLGTKVAPARLIEAVREHRPDLIGLSGLLVKSAEQMVVTAEELARAGIDVPLLVGGAGLSEGFVRWRIAPVYRGVVAYAEDALKGLEIANRLLSKARSSAPATDTIISAPESEPAGSASATSATSATSGTSATSVTSDTSGTVAYSRSRLVPILPPEELPEPPDFERHVLRNIDLDEIWAFINPVMLYNRHLGLRRNFDRALAEGDIRAATLKQLVEELKDRCRREGLLRVHAVWQFFRAASSGNRIYLFDPTRRLPPARPAAGEPVEAGEPLEAAEPVAVFTFPRQPYPDGLCLADYVAPFGEVPAGAVAGAAAGAPAAAATGSAAPAAGARVRDSICLFVVTAGEGVREAAEHFREQGELLRSYALQALALEAAEAAAEWLHARIRAAWGFPDDPAMTMKDRFQARYRGRRYSFGYPACPDLSQQRDLFRLLRPEEIGVTLAGPGGHQADGERTGSEQGDGGQRAGIQGVDGRGAGDHGGSGSEGGGYGKSDGYMMDPEASVSALVFHHPSCRYFDARRSPPVEARG